jgi:pyruvate formate lyase activating enzyme
MPERRITECTSCGRASPAVAAALGHCAACIREGSVTAAARAAEVHARARKHYGLRESVPADDQGVRCGVCVNRCVIGEGRRGYCGLRENRQGRLVELGGTPERGFLEWYYDPLPTNCVADWVCAGGSAAGYPTYSRSRGPEYGWSNLAVFYRACTFDCLFCQNWHFREGVGSGRTMSARGLAESVSPETTCICFFGGDPTPQMLHSLAVAEEALALAGERPLRICWETNGSMSRNSLERMTEVALSSGGTIKIDLKTWDPRLSRALCGVGNEETLENFAFVASRMGERPDPPLLVASTLLVPGYVDEQEVSAIAGFIASSSPDIPYALLAFHPAYLMDDLPTTSRSEAVAAEAAAKAAGLARVRIGNIHLLR